MRYASFGLMLLALGGCGGDGAGNEAAAGNAAAPGDPVDLEAGNWRSEIVVEAIDEPGGLDPDGSFARQMAQQLSGRNRCMAPDVVRNAVLHETLSSGPWKGGNCVYSRRSVTTTGVDIAMDCEGLGPGHRLQTTVRGSASPRETDVTIENRSRHPRTGAPWVERYRVRSTWTAPNCRGNA